MNIRRSLIMVLAAVGGICTVATSANATETDRDGKSLRFVAYPDGSNWLMADMLRRLGRAYEKNNPEVTIELRSRTGYKEARSAALNGEAAGMIISEDINKIRAYVTTIQKGRAFGRGYARELKLNRFIPIAVRTIRNDEGEVVAKMRFGIATDRVSGGLNGLLSFLDTDAANEALADIPDMVPARPADEPSPVTEVRKAQGYRWKEPQTLPEPILTY